MAYFSRSIEFFYSLVIRREECERFRRRLNSEVVTPAEETEVATSVKTQCVSAAEEIGAAAFVIARHVSSAKRMGAVAFVIAQRVSAAKESEVAQSGSAAILQEFQRCCANHRARCYSTLVPALSSVRKLSRMRASAQHRSQYQAAAPYNKRINSAPVGRPTRKVRCTLLAGYAQRYKARRMRAFSEAAQF